MSEPTNLTDVEWRVLEVISDGYDELCYGLNYIATGAGLHRELVRGALRSLAEKGLAHFNRGLMTEDGYLAGSGYGATEAGAARWWNRRAEPVPPPAQDPAGARRNEETGWLIENFTATGEPLASWWSLSVCDGWTTDSTEALRFARAEDAQAYIEEAGWTTPKPTQHIWMGPQETVAIPILSRLGGAIQEPEEGR